MGTTGLVVGLTGATGHIGGCLLRRLAVDPAVAEVRSVARRPLGPPVGLQQSGRKFVHVRADVAAPAARRALDGADIVYHLAAQVWDEHRGRGTAAMYGVNVLGTANIAGADVGAVVLASSVAVYGAWPGNPLPMDEGCRPAPNPECPYAQQKLVAEMVCADVARRWAAVRLCAVLGPHADARVARAVQGLRLAVPAVRGVAQAVQWLDEDDAVAGLLAAGRALVEGRSGVDGEVFNAATTDWLGAPEVARLAGGHVVELPRSLLMRGAELGRWAGLAPFGQDRAVLVDGPLAISPAKAGQVLGWAPAKSSSQVLGAALRRGWKGAPVNRLPS